MLYLFYIQTLGKPSNRKSPKFSGIFPTLVKPPPPGIRENQMKMEKIFFAFLDELAHSKQFFKHLNILKFIHYVCALILLMRPRFPVLSSIDCIN